MISLSVFNHINNYVPRWTKCNINGLSIPQKIKRIIIIRFINNIINETIMHVTFLYIDFVRSSKPRLGVLNPDVLVVTFIELIVYHSAWFSYMSTE
jgi:hypothetical protein